jgi:hypothetical protein
MLSLRSRISPSSLYGPVCGIDVSRKTSETVVRSEIEELRECEDEEVEERLEKEYVSSSLSFVSCTR